jgi:hypothetical protein
MLIIHSLIILILSLPVWAADEDPAVVPEAADTQVTNDETSSEPSTTAPQEGSKPLVYVTPDKAQQRVDDTLRYLKTFQRESEIIEIGGMNGPFSGLYLPENTGKPQGGVLILHDIAQHAHWPNTVSPIREYLPDYGWNTLSIFFEQYIQKPLPDIPEPVVQSMPETSEATSEETDNTQTAAQENLQETPNPQPDIDNIDTAEIEEGEAPSESLNNDPLDTIANSLESVPDFQPAISPEVLSQPAIPIEDVFTENMTQRVEDSLNKLNELGQYNLVIIANGYSANWAAKILEKRLENNTVGYALILIDAKSSDYPKVALNESLAKLDIPMLDIITDASEEMKLSIKTRKGVMLRNQNSKYMQLYLPAIKPDLTQTNNIISRRIRGWLLTHAAGEEIAVKEKGKY